jgi:hypothetical protein
MVTSALFLSVSPEERVDPQVIRNGGAIQLLEIPVDGLHLIK